MQLLICFLFEPLSNSIPVACFRISVGYRCKTTGVGQNTNVDQSRGKSSVCTQRRAGWDIYIRLNYFSVTAEVLSSLVSVTRMHPTLNFAKNITWLARQVSFVLYCRFQLLSHQARADLENHRTGLSAKLFRYFWKRVMLHVFLFFSRNFLLMLYCFIFYILSRRFNF